MTISPLPDSMFSFPREGAVLPAIWSAIVLTTAEASATAGPPAPKLVIFSSAPVPWFPQKTPALNHAQLR